MTPIDKIFIFFLSLVLGCLLLLFSSITAQAQNYSVESARSVLIRLAEISKHKDLQTEAAQKILSGEMQNLKAATLGNLSDAPDKILLLEESRAVGRFQLTLESARSLDVYFFLRFDQSWTVYAVRALALPRFMEQLYADLKARQNLTEQEKLDLANLKLMFASDQQLKTWFTENRPALEKFAADLGSKKGKTVLYFRSGDEGSREASELRKLNLSLASVEPNGNVSLIIGGVTDNTVGIIYSPTKRTPEITTLEYIWVEEIAPGWYLYRTT